MNYYQPVPFQPLKYFSSGGQMRLFILLWLIFCLLVIPSGMLTRVFELTGITLNLLGVEIYLTVYIPMIFCVPLCLVFGFVWAAIPAYFSTFLVAILGDMPIHWIAIFSFANPVGLAMLAMIYRITPVRVNLRSMRAYFVFVVACFLSALSGSIGSFIWTYTNDVDIHDFYQVWQGWWIGGLLQAAVLSGLILFFFADRLIKWKARFIAREPSRKDTRKSIKMAVVIITMVLIMFTWLALYFNMLNIEDKLNLVEDIEIKSAINEAVKVLNFPAMVFVFILAFIGYFILYFVDYWAARLEGVNLELEKQNRQLYESSIKDSLTKIHNRAYLFSRLPQVITEAKSGKGQLALLLIDLDHFKSINDTYGHQAGDLVLQKFSEVVSASVVGEQIFARFGGEEFMVVLPESGVAEAERFVKEQMNVVRQLSVPYKQHRISFTVSIGIYVTDRLDEPVDHMIDETDKALYVAKENGRNQAFLVTDVGLST